MATINLKISDYPGLDLLIPGQKIEAEIEGEVGVKTMTSDGEYITLIVNTIEIEPERRPSVQEVLLASIAKSVEGSQVPRV